MLLNPKSLNCVSGAEEGQFQPNGVDIRINKVMVVAEDAIFTMSEHPEDKVSKQIASNVDDLTWQIDEKGHFVHLMPGYYYLFDSLEEVSVPEDVAGKLILRSSANRATMRIESGLYDSGFQGNVGGSITVTTPIKIYSGTRVAQMIFWKADPNGKYNGQWQNKNSIGL